MNTIFKIVFASLLLLSTALATFKDVKNTTDYQTAINSMVDLGVINGYPDGSFQPDKCVNRVEFLKMLFLANQTNQTKQSSASNSNKQTLVSIFPDTQDGQWYSPYLFTALMRNIVAGYPDGFFRPENCVNRAEAVKMAILEFNNGQIPNYEEGLWSFSDIDKSQWYAKYMVPALFNNLVGTRHAQTTSVSSADYLPAGPMTRGEVAEMLFRMKTVKDKGLTAYSAQAFANELAFDACGKFSKYESKSWFPSLQASLQSQYNQSFTKSGEGCLSLDGNLFIFIPNTFEFGCGKIMSYDNRSGIVQSPEQNYCATEFHKRVANYVNFTGEKINNSTCDKYSGKYYFNENRVEFEHTVVDCDK